MTRSGRTLDILSRVAAALERHGIPTALIGAAAMAIHNYPRATQDVDLATHVDPFGALRAVEADLRSEGLAATLELPDADDPLGGVLRVTGDDFDTIDVVNYLNPYRAGASRLAAEAISTARNAGDVSPGVRVVDVPHLVALKLYAGGMKSASDVVELLNRNGDSATRAAVAEVCGRFGLTEEFERIVPHLR